MREVSANLARIILRMAIADDLCAKNKTKDEVKKMLADNDYDEVMEILGSYPSWLK